MRPIDIPAIERHARALRAAEMRRLEDICIERLRLVAVLAGASLAAALEVVAEAVRPAFSWNPQHRH